MVWIEDMAEMLLLPLRAGRRTAPQVPGRRITGNNVALCDDNQTNTNPAECNRKKVIKRCVTKLQSNGSRLQIIRMKFA